MPEPSLALLQTLIERLIVEQRQALKVVERIELALERTECTINTRGR